MKKTNQKELLNKYKKIFRQYKLPPTQTAMCWGLECGEGWYNLIDNLCFAIQKYIDETGAEQIEATQVKQKFGSLRFYYHPYEVKIDKMIDKAMTESIKTCEDCGDTVGVKISSGVWKTPLCKRCMKK